MIRRPLHSRLRAGSSMTGFTLIELLVVIAIISVLAALLVPAVRRARDSGISAVCVSAERQFGIAMASYQLDHDNKLVPATAGFEQAFDVLLDPYLNTLPPIGNTEVEKGGLWTCPADYLEPIPSFVPYQRRSYAMNHYLTYAGKPNSTTILDELPRRAVALGEAWEAVIGTRRTLGASQVWNTLSGLAIFRYGGNLFGLYHFQEGSNYLFTDGSVEYISVRDIADRTHETGPARKNGLFYWE